MVHVCNRTRHPLYFVARTESSPKRNKIVQNAAKQNVLQKKNLPICLHSQEENATFVFLVGKHPFVVWNFNRIHPGYHI